MYLYNLISFLITAIVLSLIVFVHEMGHFLMARFYGLPVKRFSIGFGPLIWGFKDRKNTVWQLSAIPLGGYVQMDQKGLFGLRKVVVALAGPLMNFLFSFTIFASLLWAFGTIKVSPIVKEVAPNSLAAQNDIRPNDEILTVNDLPVMKIHETLKQFKKATIKIKRGDEVLKKDIIMLEPKLGIMFETEAQKLTLLESLRDGAYLVWSICRMMFEDMLTLTGLKNVGGLVAIFSASKANYQNGLQSFLSFIAVFSVNLGFLNVLPIPILDGGNAMIGVYEMIMQRRLKKAVYQQIMLVGAWVLLFLFVVGFMNDIFRRAF